MDFHTDCPITCRKICFCPHGFPKGKNEFLRDVTRLEEFHKDPWPFKAREGATSQVKVPKLDDPPPPQAFHTACPITCRKICFCPLGFPKGKNEFLGDVTRLEEFLKDPWPFKARQPATIQVKVPKLVVPPPPQAPVSDGGGGGSRDGEEVAAIASAQTKRITLQ